MIIEKPRQGWAGLWNISFGFFGIQIGFALQNANMSRVFQSLGSSLDPFAADGGRRNRAAPRRRAVGGVGRAVFGAGLGLTDSP